MTEKKPTCRADELAAWLRKDADEAEAFGALNESPAPSESAAMEREAADLIDSLASLLRPRCVGNVQEQLAVAQRRNQ